MRRPLIAAAYLALAVFTSGNTKTLGQDLPEPVLRPEQFGAVGDGEADDTKAIQACLDQLAARQPDANGHHKGTVLLDGTYHVTRQAVVRDMTSQARDLEAGPHWRVFHVPSGVTVAGDGTLTLLRGGQSPRDQVTGYTYLFWIAASASDALWPLPPETPNHQVRDVTIRGLTLLNDAAGLIPHPDVSESAAIVINHGVNVRVIGVTMRHWHRGIQAVQCAKLTIEGCTAEETRYMGIALYGSTTAPNAAGRNIVANNTLMGHAYLAGGIYIGGIATDVRDNVLRRTYGIVTEYADDVLISGNTISRQPYAIRIGNLNRVVTARDYFISEAPNRAGYPAAASRVRVENNEVAECAGGIMVGNSAEVLIASNRLHQFMSYLADVFVDHPKGDRDNYWSDGRVRAAINVEDSTRVEIHQNAIMDLSTGTPVGIRVANSRFTLDPRQGCYSVTDAKDPPQYDWNSAIVIRENKVDAIDGLQIAYYIENQKAYTFEGNAASAGMATRIIASSGEARGNQLNDPAQVVDEATEECPRLVLETHPMHWRGRPLGSCKYESPGPAFNQYYPPEQ